MKKIPCPKCDGSGQVPDQEAISKELRALRTKAGISLRRMAYRLKVSPPFLSDMELGKRNWNMSRIEEFKTACKQLL